MSVIHGLYYDNQKSDSAKDRDNYFNNEPITSLEENIMHNENLVGIEFEQGINFIGMNGQMAWDTIIQRCYIGKEEKWPSKEFTDILGKKRKIGNYQGAFNTVVSSREELLQVYLNLKNTIDNIKLQENNEYYSQRKR